MNTLIGWLAFGFILVMFRVLAEPHADESMAPRHPIEQTETPLSPDELQIVAELVESL